MNVLNKLKKRKSAVEGNLTLEIIKQGNDILVEEVCLLFNEVLIT